MKQRIKYYNRRVIVSGNVVEIIETENSIFKGYVSSSAGRANSKFTSDETKQANRQKIATRARSTVRRVVNANSDIFKKFFTLTFAENLTDIKKARYEFDKFIKRVKTIYRDFKYIEVIEFQKRGSIHFHMLCNLPYIDNDKLAEIWGHGFIKINRIDNVDNLGAYITKYMTKDSIDDRLVGKKCYSMSKGLRKPTELTNEEDIDIMLKSISNIKRVQTSQFESEYLGVITYVQIVCSTFQKFFKRRQSIKDLIELPSSYMPPAGIEVF